ncbi:uncharacterized protein [Lepeophtheirus salmonis]|uniref:uncharacterized protein n=1 Tax=Lepeophtheirus salmonis TaxID=72036 RepID=UPI001AE2B082|nr:uncharacterized protein LOC121123467 [Lepeophtheirus salmonis]
MVHISDDSETSNNKDSLSPYPNPRPTTLDLSSKSHHKNHWPEKKSSRFHFPPLLPTRSQSAPGCILVKKRDSIVLALSVTDAITISTTSVKELTVDDDEEYLKRAEEAKDVVKASNKRKYIYRLFIVTVMMFVILMAGSASLWSVRELLNHSKQWKSVVNSPRVEESEKRSRFVHPKDFTGWSYMNFSKYRNTNNPERKRLIQSGTGIEDSTTNSITDYSSTSASLNPS